MKVQIGWPCLLLLLAAGCAPTYPKSALRSARVVVPAVKAKVPGPCSIARDNNDNGKLNQWTAYSYDKKGQVGIAAEYDNPTGKPTLVTLNSYDGAGHLVKQVVKRGRARSILRYDYNGKGELTRMAVDENGDGNVDNVTRYAYDAAGNRVRSAFYLAGRSHPQSVTVFTYNPGGLLVQEATDVNNDGKMDRRILYSYDRAGNKVVEKTFWSGSPKPSMIAHYYYDKNHHRIRKTVDENGNGSIDRETDYKVDSFGNTYAKTDILWGKIISRERVYNDYSCWEAAKAKKK